MQNPAAEASPLWPAAWIGFTVPVGTAEDCLTHAFRFITASDNNTRTLGESEPGGVKSDCQYDTHRSGSRYRNLAWLFAEVLDGMSSFLRGLQLPLRRHRV
jgi:hypothetical protein